MKATLDFGRLLDVSRCQIFVPNYGTIDLRILPEITDTKSASYHDDHVIGRSFPIKSYSHSDNRSITMVCHFVVLEDFDAELNLQYLRVLQSAVYPRESEKSPYLPPPICKIRCGRLLAGQTTGGWICVILKSYSVSFPTDVAWYCDKNGVGNYVPYKFDVTLNWEVVYANENLPGQSMIMGDI